MGLHIIDVSDPAQPVEVTFYDTPGGGAWDVVVSGGYAYVADGYSGLRIYDLSHTWRVIIAHTTIYSGHLNATEKTHVLTSTIGGNISAGNGSIVQNTSADGSIAVHGSGSVVNNATGGAINLSRGIAQNNSVTGAGISVNIGSALTNTVRGGIISVENGGVARNNSVENAPGWGILASGDATVQYNRVVGCADGIQASGGAVRGNLVANTVGVGLELVGSVLVEDNTFTGVSGSAAKITSGTAVKLTDNNFVFNPGQFDVENLVVQATLMLVDARHNWWGTTSGAAIQQRIFDSNDDYTIGTVLYSPVLTQPSPVAPAYVRAITLTPESPVGIQTVAFDVLSSREMDTSNNPAMAFHTTQVGDWQTYDTSTSELAHDRLQAIAVDVEGNKWFGTGGGGVSVLHTNGTWQTYNTSNSGLAHDFIFDIAVDAVGNKWFGFGFEADPSGVVSVLHTDGTWRSYHDPDSSVWTIAVDSAGNKWFGTWDSGVSVLRGGAEYDIAGTPQWPAPNLYRATYGFSTLIPRDTYTITISGARTPATMGSGTASLLLPSVGMEIAPNSAYTLTVDYAGYINDTTAPPAPTVTACAAFTPDTLTAHWSAHDPESEIDRYQYAIGIGPGGAEVINWTFTTLTVTTRSSLSLVAGQTYYVSVKARNGGGIWSEAGSVGVVAGSGECVGPDLVYMPLVLRNS